MATFTGNFQYTSSAGTQQQGPCRIEFDKETFALTSESAAPLSFDLGDIDGIVSERHQLRLPLYTGAVLLLDQFGSSYDNLVLELTKAHREREVQCLLLADMPEIARFPGHFERIDPGARCSSCGALGGCGKFCRECGHPLAQTLVAEPSSGEAEIRLYKSNVAVLPEHAPGFQVRLGDAKRVAHQDGSYDVLLDLGTEALKFSALGKRTNEFADKLRRAISDMQAASAQALHLALPFLDADQIQRVATLLPEGSSAAVAALTQIDPRIADALVKNAVDKDLQPYYQELLGRAVSGSVWAGFKLIRPENQQVQEADEPEDHGDAVDADEKGPDAIYWFFFPIAAKGDKPDVVAWEASSRGGRATYFFRIDGNSALDQQIHRLNRGLGILNFRRRPIYLGNAELAMNPIFRRYAIAARRIPEVRQLRTAFLGRAIHSSVEAWREQVEGILGNA